MPIRIAIIGADDAARALSETLGALESARVVAVCAGAKNAIEYAKAETLARRCKARAFRDIKTLLRDEKTDALCVVAHGKSRRDAQTFALQNGLDFLLAPPFSPSLESAQNLLKEVAQARGRLWVSHRERFGDAAQSARKLLSTRGQTPLSSFGSWSSPNGNSLESSTRLVGLLRFLNGEITHVFARSSATLSINCEFADRSSGAFVLGENCENILCFQMRNQHLEWRDHALTIRCGREMQRIEYSNFEYSNDAARDELRAWIQSVESGRRTLGKSNAPDALQSLRVALAIQQSSKTGKQVCLS